MKRHFFLVYAAIAYVIAMINIAYIMGFLIDFLVPKGINSGTQGDFWTAVVLDLSLVWLFGIQHSLTARTWFKKYWTKIVPAQIERATYLYMTAVMTWILVYYWRPIPETLWLFENSFAFSLMITAYLLVWAIMFAATFHFGHFGFFGMAQAWSHFKNQSLKEGNFCARWVYAVVRHPISLGWMLTPWLTPHMTVGQLVFAIGATSYVIAATPFEEGDLISDLGDQYREYRKKVPAFFPFFKP